MGAFDAEKWRAFHRRRGESYRWFKAVKSPETTRGEGPDGGWYHIEQDVADEWRALAHETTEEISSPEFGLVPAGATEFSVMPDESYVGRMDEIILIDRQLRGDTILTRGDTTFDAIPNAPVTAIVAVYNGDEPYVLGTDYKLNADRIEWLDNAPGEGAKYAIEYRYNPTYTCLGASPNKTPRPSMSDAAMPLRVILTLKAIGDD